MNAISQFKLKTLAKEDIKSTEVPRVNFNVDDAAAEELSKIGRTEDIMFSPDQSCLAIVGHISNCILLLSVDFHFNNNKYELQIHSPLRLQCQEFDHPHGIAWMNNNFLVVANRDKKTCVIELPSSRQNGNVQCQASLILGNAENSLVNTPGSVAATALGNGLWEILLCNNYSHEVSQHIIDTNAKMHCIYESLLLSDGLDIPDGITLSLDGHWIGISNHNEHAVRIYRNSMPLNPSSEPLAYLTNVNYPHGLRFSACGQYMIVADAGLPFVNIYKANQNGWMGSIQPIHSVRVLEDAIFLKGQYNPLEGGPKGLDFLSDKKLLVVTNHEQPLAFFDLSTLLPMSTPKVDKEQLLSARTASLLRNFTTQININHKNKQQLEDLLLEKSILLDKIKNLSKHSEALDAIRRSRSWKLTKPYRKIGKAIKSITLKK